MRLTWKELRETLPVLLLAVGLVSILALRPVFLWAGQDSIVQWQLGLVQGGTAIFFFVALVIGVLAYAIEEEQGTLQPLLARPVTTSDVFRAKVVTRVAALVTALLYFLLLQVLTGALWAGTPVRGSLSGLGAWASAVATVLFGFGIGLYFGRRMGNQTRALVAAILVFAGLWVLVGASPIGRLFEAPGGGFQYAWVRDILLPLLTGLLIIWLAGRIPEEVRGLRLAPTAVASVALLVYGTIIWLSSMWLAEETPQTALHALRDQYSIRYGSVSQTLDVLERQLRYRADQPTRNGTILYRSLGSMVVSDPAGEERLLLEPRSSRVYGNIEAGLQIPRRPVGEAGQDILVVRDREWFIRALDDLPALSERHQLLLIHLASCTGDDSVLEGIRPALSATDVRVRTLAQAVFVAFGDPQGIDAIREPTLQGDVPRAVLVAIGERMRPLMEELLISDYIGLRNAGREWFLVHGTMADRDLVRVSETLDAQSRYQVPSITAGSGSMRRYEIAWSGPERIPALRSQAQEHLAYLGSHLPEFQLLSFRLDSLRAALRTSGGPSWQSVFREKSNDLIDESGLDFSHYSRLDAILLRLAELGDTGVIPLWNRSMSLPPDLFGRVTSAVPTWVSDRTRWMLPHIAAIGGPGLDYLRGLARDPSQEPEVVFQACALLLDRGEISYRPTMLALWRDATSGERPDVGARYAGGVSRDAFWHIYGLRTLLALAREGDLVVAGSLIQNARSRAVSQPHPLHSVTSDRAVGAWFWDTDIVEALQEGTGRDLGWSLQAWSRWWDRTQRDLMAEVRGGWDVQFVQASLLFPSGGDYR